MRTTMPRHRKTLPATFPNYTEEWLQYWYRISRAQFDAMLKEQNCCCWVCLRPFSSTVKVNIDHDQSCCNTKGWEKKLHSRAAEEIAYCCGKCVRVLLCADCNRGLGALEKSGATPARVALYLAKFGKRDADLHIEESGQVPASIASCDPDRLTAK